MKETRAVERAFAKTPKCNPFLLVCRHNWLTPGKLDIYQPGKPFASAVDGLKTKYRGLISAGNDALLPLASTHLREEFFSAVTVIKTKYQTKLDLEPALRVAVSQSAKPRFSKLMKRRQSQSPRYKTLVLLMVFF